MILKDLGGKILRFCKGRLAARIGGQSETGFPRHCLHLYPVREGEPRKLAVLYSGDGGWARLTTQVSRRLQEAGIAVVGVDSMQCFWKRNTAEEAAGNLTAAIEYYTDSWRVQEVVLLGYSMGADVLPQIILRLPDAVKQRLSRLILISPGHYGYLKFRFIGWLGYETPARLGRALLPDISALTPLTVSCFAGETETGSLVPHLRGVAIHAELLPGGHHYGGDYGTLAQRILKEIDRHPIP